MAGLPSYYALHKQVIGDNMDSASAGDLHTEYQPVSLKGGSINTKSQLDALLNDKVAAEYIQSMKDQGYSLDKVGHAKGGDLFGDIMAFVAPPVATLSRMQQGAEEGDWYSVAHNALSFSPMIDTGINNVGRKANEWTDGEAGKVVSVAGPTIGGIIGGAYGGPWGGVGGAMIGKQFAGRFNNLPEEDIQHGTALTGAVGAASVGAGELLSGLATLNTYGEGLAKAGSTAFDSSAAPAVSGGAVNFAPAGAGSLADSVQNPTTLDGIMEKLSVSGSGDVAMNTPQIPSTDVPLEQLAPEATPSPQFSASALPDSSPAQSIMPDYGEIAKGANTAFKTAKQAYGLYNQGNKLYNIYKMLTTDYDALYPTAQQPQFQVPVGTPQIGNNFSNMPTSEKDRRAWGTVLV